MSRRVNLLHEDHDMMAQIAVDDVDFNTNAHHPIKAATPVPDNA